MIAATALVLLNTRGLCGEPAGPVALHRARTELVVVVALSAAPWLGGALVARRRRRPWARLVAAAGLVSLYPAWWLVGALEATPAAWTTSWCLF
jgi:hypothetical protein